jgi:serine protease Do
MLRYCTSLLLALSMSCAAPTVHNKPKSTEPIDVHDRAFEPLEFRGLLVEISKGASAGTHYDGILYFPQSPAIRDRSLSYWSSQELNAMARDELKRYGYNVLDGDTQPFASDDPSKARYQLRGAVVSLQCNTYGQSAGDYTEVIGNVDWELYDGLNKAVIYKERTVGRAKGSGLGPEGSHSASCSAFRDGLRELLAKKGFVEVIGKGGQVKVSAAEPPAWKEIITIKPCALTADISLPRDIESALEAVVTIRVGPVAGNGIVISPDGFILTTAHLVSGTNNVSLRFHSGLTLDAQVLRSDSNHDLALLKVPGSGYKCLALELEDSSSVGADVFAIRTSFGEKLPFSVSKGIISAYRDQDGDKYIEIDASLTQANSGGPLVVQNGRVVAILGWRKEGSGDSGVGQVVAPTRPTSWREVGNGGDGAGFGIPVSLVSKRLGISWEQ